MVLGFDPLVEIALISLVFSLVSYAANKTLGQRDKVKAFQKEVKEYQNEMQKALKANDSKKLEELKKHDKEFNDKMMQMVLMPWKASIIILPIAWILIAWVLPPLYPGFVILLPFDIHTSAILSLTFYSNILHTAAYGTTGFFIVCAIVFGLLLEPIGSRLWPAKQ
ncbi:MAG TPA: EMC3/TMCO1 family protein [Candidatus Norongarragalinales archaeon]|nr:EMC3/TMCO1 family protein [Candidatus Norongarragalinales archaeon]